MFSKIINRINVPEHARVERIVHDLDGIEQVVHPEKLLNACSSLWSLALDSHAQFPDYLLGFDSGGIIPTIGLSLVSGVPYKLAYKLNLDLADKILIREPYASNQDIFVYNVALGRTVILVDDEVSSGETVRNAIITLRARGVEVLAALCLVEDTRLDARVKIEALNVKLCSLIRLS